MFPFSWEELFGGEHRTRSSRAMLPSKEGRGRVGLVVQSESSVGVGLSLWEEELFYCGDRFAVETKQRRRVWFSNRDRNKSLWWQTKRIGLMVRSENRRLWCYHWKRTGFVDGWQYEILPFEKLLMERVRSRRVWWCHSNRKRICLRSCGEAACVESLMHGVEGQVELIK